jgi:hypothetical protein
MGTVRGLDFGAVVDRIEALDDPEYQVNLWRLHLMCNHRGITVRELAKETGKDHTWVGMIYYGRASVFGRKHGIAIIEDAITRITDRRGGIPEACCSVAGLEEMTDVLEHPSVYAS